MYALTEEVKLRKLQKKGHDASSLNTRRPGPPPGLRRNTFRFNRLLFLKIRVQVPISRIGGIVMLLVPIRGSAQASGAVDREPPSIPA
jgi:hypothetical protein